jgi:hypothetical protein
LRTLGIDPGARTGIAVWDDRRGLIYIGTVAKDNAFTTILNVARRFEPERILIERNLDTVYQRPGATARGMAKIGKNVGMNIEFATQLCGRLMDEGFPAKCVAPMKSFTKWPREMWERHMGYVGTASEHARDAALLARHF